jgi:hypothetical protein
MANKIYPAWQRRYEAVLRYMFEHPAARYREIAREHSAFYCCGIKGETA